MELLEIKNIKSEIKYSLVLINNRLAASEKKSEFKEDVEIKLQLNIEQCWELNRASVSNRRRAIDLEYILSGSRRAKE